LWSSEGVTNAEIGERLNWSKPTVGKWRQRFVAHRLQGLYDELGPGRHDYNHHRPHSALADRTPNEFATTCSGGKDGDRAALENAARFPLSLRAATAGFFSEKRSVLKPVAGGRHLSYSNCKSAGKSGTNRTTQAEISNLLRLSFPGRVKNRESPVMTG
jgi:hypothetical protein